MDQDGGTGDTGIPTLLYPELNKVWAAAGLRRKQAGEVISVERSEFDDIAVI